MRARHWVVWGGAVVGLLLACGAEQLAVDGGPADAGVDGAIDAGSSCTPCVIDTDCNGGVCAPLGAGGTGYCATPCPNGNECAPSETCTGGRSISGDLVTICVQTASAVCGAVPDAGLIECPGFADPFTTAGCTACTLQSRPDCQKNGCYNGFYCNELYLACQAQPLRCTPDAGPPPIFFDGGPVTSAIGFDGGTESVLYFGIVGDTRPATADDTAHYPTPIITRIFDDLGGVTPVPPFVVSTGDYQYSTPNGNEALAQLQIYQGARANYPGIQFPTMGNHECTGATASNCGTGNADGTPNTYQHFVNTLLAPIQKTTQFVFVAANAWDSTQAAWLDAALAATTTYTFVVRHEPAAAVQAPGVVPCETAMAAHPYTLSIVGHSHEYRHSPGSRELLVGNGGAPIATGDDFGYAIVAQRADLSLAVDMIDYMSGEPDLSFHFAVNPDGTPATP
jgi:hypothetical protein